MLLVALPPGPHYGGYPFGLAENFRRAKSGVLECNSFRPHWGPEPAKFRTFAVQDLRLALPNQRSRCVSAVGATLAVAQKPSPLGEGAPEGGG